jgi:hypothetical protein
MYGKSHTDETLKKLSDLAKNNWQNSDYAAKIHSKLHAPTLLIAQVAAVLHDMWLLPGDFEYNGECDAGVNVDGLTPDFVSL